MSTSWTLVQLKGGFFQLAELKTILGKPLRFFRGFWVVWLVCLPFKFLSSFLSLSRDSGHLQGAYQLSLPCNNSWSFLSLKRYRGVRSLYWVSLRTYTPFSVKNPCTYADCWSNNPRLCFRNFFEKRGSLSLSWLKFTLLRDFLDYYRVSIYSHILGIGSSLLVFLGLLVFSL